jgi:type I restriction enzyme S subunit
MAATDLQQPEIISQITGPLVDFVEFKNGRSSPDRTDSGAFAVYGSNGEIGKADVTNAPEGTLVVGRVGSYCGSVHYSPNKCWVTDNAIIGSSRSQKDSRFWFYKLASLDLNNYRAGSGQPLLNQQILNSIQVSIPASEDDRFQIAKALAAFDDKIDLNRRINQTLEAMAQALFKSWFVDFDPVKAKIAAIQQGRDPLRAAMSAISGKPETELDALPPEQYEQLAATAALFPAEMEESELGEIPRGWQTLPVYDIATYVNGTAFKAFQPNDERRGLPIIKIAELKAGVTAQTKFSDVAMPEKYRLRTGDILFSWSGNPDTSIDTFIWAHGDAWLNQHIFRVDIHSPNERAFVIATLEYLRPVLAEIARNKQTTGLGHVTVGDMQRLLVVKPEEQALAAWDRMAAPIFAAAFRNEADSISLTQLRDTLLPKLLSGELPVENLSPDLEATV